MANGRHGRPEVQGPPSAVMWVELPVPVTEARLETESVRDAVEWILADAIGPDKDLWPVITVRRRGRPGTYPVIRLAGTAENVTNGMLPMLARWAQVR